MKTSKKIISLVLCIVMIATTFFCTGVLPELKAEAAITLGGITQNRVVSDYVSKYATYQNRFFTGSESNEPTNFVIPGLSQSNDYTPQGMTYWEEKEWILISAYDASGSGKHSVIYALDAVTTEFVALFKILNQNGSVNTSHGGGIAASEHNFYYADTASKISYFPLSEMDVPKNTVKEIKLRGSIDCGGELGGAATSYCCYEDGVLWAGNFYYSGDDRYKTPAHTSSNSMIVGYRLHGNSSAEEWYYLSTNFNLVRLNTDSTDEQTVGNMTFRTYNTDGANAEVRGTISKGDGGEVTHKFCTLNLTEGKTYKIEFIADNNLSDMYMFAPNEKHCNVKQSTASKITNLGNGKYHYQMIFTAGLRPTGADSSWPTTQSTDGTYTGTYTMRFDQDSVPASGRTFNITDISVSEYVEPNGFEPDSSYEGTGCAGNPTYVVMIAGIDKVQYAMVYKGKFYISRSWKRVEGDNHTRELMIGDIDLNSPGANNFIINGRTRPCHTIDMSNVTRFGGDQGSGNLGQMLFMGEALCVMDDYLYMFGEGAAWAYNGKESSKCPEPIDVIWKIDQHMIMGEERTYDDTAPKYYEKVNSLSEINLNDDYLIVHESSVKDPVTQKNILYAIDSHGGYGANRLPKQDAGTQANSADSMGLIGYEIKDYSVDTVNDKQVIYVPDEVDTTKSLHWQIQGATTGNLRLNNKDLYYAKNNHLYFGSRLFAMTTDARSNLDLIKLEQYGASNSGDFRLSYQGEATYYLWCNNGSDESLIDTYSNYYSNHGKAGYVPQYHGLEEIPGTFHADADAVKDKNNSGNLIGKTVGIDKQIIHIYKRVADPYSSAYDTRVTTDLSAELQSDGTYNIKMETYAISELQFQTVDERPTDFIFVLDSSGSMSTEDCNGFHRHNKFDLEAACGTDEAAGKTNNSTNSGTTGTYTGNMWIQHTDGVLCPVSCKVQGDGRKYEFPSYTYYQRVYLWYTHPTTGVKYWFHVNSNNEYGTWTTSETTYDQAMRIGASSKGDRAGRVVFGGVCYEKRSNSSRFSNLQIAVNQLTWKIQEKAQSTGLDHRIAVVQYGSNSSGSWTNTGMYTTANTTRVAYTGADTVSKANYQKAFHSVSQFGNVRNIIDNMSASGDTFVDYGLDMAYNILANSDASYLADGNRSACIITITDGCPGFGGDDSATATTVANAAIKNAYNIKHSGGYIYSIQMGNNSMSGFDMDKYMDYVSSEFIYAQSMTDPGDRNTKDIAYRIDVPIAGFNLDFLVSSIFESVTSNSKNAIATLNANSILREQLTNAFVIPSDAKTTIQVAKHDYDGLGRLYFKDPTTAESSIKATLNRNTNEILITGYDYSSRYVAKSNVGDGDKLIVTISGVLANSNISLVNTSINVDEKTAIYQNQTFMNKDSAVKRFPTEHFTIPEYNYIMDYDIPMYDSDINGTLCSVDSVLQRQSTYKTTLDTDNMGIEFTNGNKDMIYTLNSRGGTSEEMNKGYVLIKRDDGTYDWFRLNIIPASTVYYEEGSFVKKDPNSNYTDWTQKGSSSAKQQLSALDDVYGSDPAYANSTDDFSLGTHKEVTVSNTNKRSKTETFTFKGTGFDLYSACGPNTGIQTVTVKRGGADSTDIAKVYIVDTYYNDANKTIYQVPVVHFKDDYGTYTVETTATYYSFAAGLKHNTVAVNAVEGTDIEASSTQADYVTSADLFAQVGLDELSGSDVEFVWMDNDSVLNGGEGAVESSVSTQAGLDTSTTTPVTSLINYVDGFRIYNPMDTDDADYIVSERGAKFYNVIDTLTLGGMGIDGSFIGYLEGGNNGSVLADYTKSGGPKHEVYLKPGNSIALRFKATFPNPDTAKAMVSIRAASGATNVKFSSVNTKGETIAYETDVKSASETYYDITSNSLSGTADGHLIVTITNTGSNLLAVDNIKLTNAELNPLSGVSIAEFNELISTQAITVDPSVFSHAKTESKYADYVPASPNANADKDLDVEGSIPDYVPQPVVDDNAFSRFVDYVIYVLGEIFSFLKNFVLKTANTVFKNV